MRQKINGMFMGGEAMEKQKGKEKTKRVIERITGRRNPTLKRERGWGWNLRRERKKKKLKTIMGVRVVLNWGNHGEVRG